MNKALFLDRNGSSTSSVAMCIDAKRSRGDLSTDLRFFNVYGNGENSKGDSASIVTILLKARKNGQALVIYGDGRQARDLIQVPDAARTTVDLLEEGVKDVYNVRPVSPLPSR